MLKAAFSLYLFAFGGILVRPASLVPVGPETTFRGYLVYGHEAHTFTPCGSNAQRWVLDRSGELRSAYESLRTAPYQPLYAELRGATGPAPAEGFGAEYDSQITVSALLRLQREGRGCREDLAEFEFRARGNEPHWVLTIAERGISYFRLGGPRLPLFPYAVPEKTGNTIRFTTRGGIPSRSLVVRLRTGHCTDTMSGERFSYHATVEEDGHKLEGCAYPGDPPSSGPVRYHQQTMLDQHTSDHGGETWFRFARPVIESGLPSPAREAVDRAINGWLERPLVKNRSPAPPGQLAARWQEDYRRFKTRFPTSSQNWFLCRTVTVAGNSAAAFSLRLDQLSDLGGAHPIQDVDLINFDPVTGDRLDLSAIIKQSSSGKLREIAEQEFRRARRIPPNQKLSAAGFTFENNRFRLPPNFAVTKTGLLFRFNHYEAGPYAVGPTEFKLPYTSIRDLLQPAFQVP